MVEADELKKQIKSWERKFEEAKGRKVGKDDIKALPHIHELYRRYNKTKEQIPASQKSENAVPSEEGQSGSSNLSLANTQSSNAKQIAVRSNSQISSASGSAQSNAAVLGSLFRSKTAAKRLKDAADAAAAQSSGVDNKLKLAANQLSVEEMERIALNRQKAIERKEAWEAKQSEEISASGEAVEQVVAARSTEKENVEPASPETSPIPTRVVREKTEKPRGIGALLRTTSLSKVCLQTPEVSRKVDLACSEELTPFNTSIDLTCYEVLEPPPHLAQSSAPSKSVPSAMVQGDDDGVAAKLGEELEAMSKAVGLDKLPGSANFDYLKERAMKQAATYAEKKTHPLECKMPSKVSAEKAPLRENFVRMQIGKRKKFKGRGSKSGGCKPMGYSKFGKWNKNKCYACGKSGHWASNCPTNGGQIEDGGDQLEDILDDITHEGGSGASSRPPLSETYVVKTKRSSSGGGGVQKPKQQSRARKPSADGEAAPRKRSRASTSAVERSSKASQAAQKSGSKSGAAKKASARRSAKAGDSEEEEEEEEEAEDVLDEEQEAEQQEVVEKRTLRTRSAQPKVVEQCDEKSGNDHVDSHSDGDIFGEDGENEESEEEEYEPEAPRPLKRRRAEQQGDSRLPKGETTRAALPRAGARNAKASLRPAARKSEASSAKCGTTDAAAAGEPDRTADSTVVIEHGGASVQVSCNPGDEVRVSDPTEAPMEVVEEVEAAQQRTGVEQALSHGGEKGSQTLLQTLQTVFGHKQFRSGQEEALERILAGKSTLFVSATGGGKSLCFQLPAMHIKGATLVISPLLSLIQDQIAHMPPGIVGATLNSNQTRDEQQLVVEGLKEGKVHVLFVAPERLFTEAFLQLARILPPFQLACVDEAHCVSEWAHNFRPSYLRLHSILRQQLKIPTILALTATATLAMQRDILTSLAIPADGVVRAGLLRDNLRLSVSRDADRQLALLELLSKDARFSSGSVIVYCTYRAQAQELASFLSNRSVKADYYHAGRSHRDRQRVQDKFMRGAVRVVAATVAFGMGIDKEDVRGVIHFNCPSSIEGYVQEIGRAGRDGLPAHCHLLFDAEDVKKQKSLARAEGVDLANVRRLVQHMVRPRGAEECVAGGWFAALEEDQEAQYDMSKPSMAAVLSLLEQHGAARVCNNGFSTGKMALLQDKQRELEDSSRVIAAIFASTTRQNGQWKFSPCDVANRVGCEPAEVAREMKELAAQRLLRVEWEGQSMVVHVLRKMDEFELEELTGKVYARMAALEQRQVQRLEVLSAMMTKAATDSWKDSATTPDKALAEEIDAYFNAPDEGGSEGAWPAQAEEKGKNRFLKADVISFVNSVRDSQQLTGRAVARVFHGVHSHAFTAKLWRNNRMWGRYDTVDFHVIQDIADQVIRTHV